MADTSKQIKFVILTETNFNPEADALTSSAVINKLTSESLYDSTKEIPIVYIEAHQKIYLNGVFYGTSTADLESIKTTLGQHAGAINTHSTAIAVIQTNLGASGDTASASGSVYARIAQLVNDLNQEVTTDRDAAISTAVGNLENTVRAFTVNGETFGASGAVTIDANEIKIGSTGTGIQGVNSTSTITDALTQLNTDISNINTAAAATGGAAMERANQAYDEALLHSSVAGSTGITVAVTAKTTSTGAIYTVAVDDTISTKEYAAGAATAAANAAVTAIVGVSGTTEAPYPLTIYGTREYAESLVNGVYDTLNGITAGTIDLINQIAAELNDPDDQNGLQSFLDKISAIGGGFNLLDGGTTGATGTIKQYIDANVTALTELINTAQGAADNSVQSVNGITGPTVVVGATDIAMTGFTSGISGNVAESDNIANAVSKVETKANAGINAAATAQSTADTALTNANDALTTLHWVIV